MPLAPVYVKGSHIYGSASGYLSLMPLNEVENAELNEVAGRRLRLWRKCCFHFTSVGPTTIPDRCVWSIFKVEGLLTINLLMTFNTVLHGAGMPYI